MLKAPKFWYKKKDTIYSASLYPFSLLFRFGTKLRNILSIKKLAPLPIICVGNIVVGGAGKTPVSLKIGKIFEIILRIIFFICSIIIILFGLYIESTI